MFDVFGSIALICALVSLLVLSVGYLAIFWHLGHRPPVAAVFGVSILKPLKGVDDGLLDNLRAIARQEHPNFEVIFGAEDPSDPALDVARQVVAEFPHLPLRIITGAFPTGLNPKVRTLRHLLPNARHEWILISDSNVRPDPHYLRAMCHKQQLHQADLVHSLLAGAHGRSLGGRLEELQLNGWVSASIALSDSLGHSCVIGKSMLMNRSALAQVGGLASVADILAEDYVLGAKLQRAGKTVVISPHLLSTVTGHGSLTQFFNRHVRWGQMRRRIAPGFYLAELSANPTPFLLLSYLLDQSALSYFAPWALLGKWALDAGVYCKLSPTPSVLTLGLMPLKDLLVPVMWLLGGVRRTVNWRGRKMLVGPGSQLFPLTPQVEANGFMPHPS